MLSRAPELRLVPEASAQKRAAVLDQDTVQHEQVMLSAMMQRADAVDAVLEKGVTVEDLSSREATLLFAAIVAVRRRDGKPDLITILSELRARDELALAGGETFIAQHWDDCPYPENAGLYADHVLAHSKRRHLRAIGEATAAAASELSFEPAAIARQHRDALDRFLAATEADRFGRAIAAINLPPAQPVVWTASRILPRAEISLFVGDGGSFKSTVAGHIAGAVAGGYPVFGEFATVRGPAYIISAEDDAAIIRMRLAACCVGEGWNEQIVLSNVHILAQPDVSLADRDWQLHIEREVLRVQPAFIVLDPYADLQSGDENSNSEQRPILRFLRKLGRDSGAAIGIVHHTGKAGADKRTIDRIRGASALVSASRSALFFDYADSGVAVQHLKSSRGPKLSPFVVQRTIESTPGNPADWISARLSFQHAATATLSRGETFVMAQVTASPGMTTSALKEAAIGTGTSAIEISNALKVLEGRGRIGSTLGARGSKMWAALTVSTLPGNLENLTLPTLPGPCPATSNTLPFDLADPVRGRGKVNTAIEALGKVEELESC